MSSGTPPQTRKSRDKHKHGNTLNQNQARKFCQILNLKPLCFFLVRLTESEEHAAELGSAVKELQDLLQEASTQYGELETRLSQSEQDAAATLQAKQEAIKALKQELKEANHLLEAVRPG